MGILPAKIDTMTRNEKLVLETLAKLNEEQQKRLIREAVADVMVGDN
ncbi:MAG: hypothetical protein E6040_09970 [Lachnospiraceae bacterium]|nr:hypothetical protein [Lachnospiraceae bacterium]